MTEGEHAVARVGDRDRLAPEPLGGGQDEIAGVRDCDEVLHAFILHEPVDRPAPIQDG